MRLTAGLLFAVIAVGSAQAQDPSPVDVRLVASTTGIEASTPFDVGVVLKMRPGWHVYWRNPGDAGLATSVRWTLPDGFSAGPLRWPVPQRFEQSGGIVGYGYADTVLLSTVVTPSSTGPGKDAVAVRADVGWLACEQICIRGKKTLALTLGGGADSSAADPGLFADWRVRLPADAGGPGAAATLATRGSVPADGRPGTVTVTVDWKQQPTGVEWFPPDDPALDVQPAESRTDGRQTTLTFRAKRLAGQEPASIVLDGVLAYTDGAGVRHGLRVPIDLDGKET
jgi:thiol:disulfide interchange protein DsbD